MTGFRFISNINFSLATTNASDTPVQEIQSQTQSQGSTTDNEGAETTLSTNIQDEPPQNVIPQVQEQTTQDQSIDQKLLELTPSDKDVINQEVGEAIDNVLANPSEDPQDMKIQICVHREKLPDGSKGECDLWLTIELSPNK